MTEAELTELQAKVSEEFAEYPPLLQKLLLRRGIATRKEADAFLNPDFNAHTHDPFLIKNMDRAVERILKGIADGERIIVFTDYDTDGIPSGVVLYDFFTKIGYSNFRNYIPHRHIEGYGLNSAAIEEFAKEGATLMITADCGISNIEEVRHAQERGIDVILTDHHLPHRIKTSDDAAVRDELPPAYAILNSKQEDDAYPFDMLCGCAVAWKLVCALLARGRERGLFAVHDGWEKWLLDMVGISTIADMVPLHGENRVLAYYGIRVLRKSPRPGLHKLCAKTRLNQRTITEEDIGFTIGPRINAASRMDVPFRAFELLRTRDEVEADCLADHLNMLNDRRKKIVAQIMKESHARLGPSFAKAAADTQGYGGRAPLESGAPLEAEDSISPIICMGNPQWQPGVLGLAASCLAEEYDRPVFLWGRGEESDLIKGSCRSDGRVNIVDLMTRAREHFIDFGGHEFSGGFSISIDQVRYLEDALIAGYAALEKRGVRDDEALDLAVDAELDLGDATWHTYRMIEHLAPFGQGNPRPLFLFKNSAIERMRWFGRDKEHISLVLSRQRSAETAAPSIEAISFFARNAPEFTSLEAGARITLAGHLEENAFFRKPELRIRIVRVHVIQ